MIPLDTVLELSYAHGVPVLTDALRTGKPAVAAQVRKKMFCLNVNGHRTVMKKF